MKFKLILCFALVLSGGLSGCKTGGTRDSRGNQQSGAVTDGLQMSLSVSKSSNPDDPEFEVAIRNVGEKDVTLNLGIMLANGKVQLPEKIRLNLADKSGKTRELFFSDKRFASISGRVDDYVVPLRSGAAYTFKLRLDQFWSPGTQEFEMKLKSARYEMSAQIQADGPGHFNTDMEGMKLMNYWKGKLESNTVVIDNR
jgi:hypothetical protein